MMPFGLSVDRTRSRRSGSPWTLVPVFLVPRAAPAQVASRRARPKGRPRARPIAPRRPPDASAFSRRATKVAGMEVNAAVAPARFFWPALASAAGACWPSRRPVPRAVRHARARLPVLPSGPPGGARTAPLQTRVPDGFRIYLPSHATRSEGPRPARATLSRRRRPGRCRGQRRSDDTCSRSSSCDSTRQDAQACRRSRRPTWAARSPSSWTAA